MRPDEHKKKKNAAYKKKHGIDTDKKRGSTSQVKDDCGTSISDEQRFDDGLQTQTQRQVIKSEVVMCISMHSANPNPGRAHPSCVCCHVLYIVTMGAGTVSVPTHRDNACGFGHIQMILIVYTVICLNTRIP